MYGSLIDTIGAFLKLSMEWFVCLDILLDDSLENMLLARHNTWPANKQKQDCGVQQPVVHGVLCHWIQSNTRWKVTSFGSRCGTCSGGSANGAVHQLFTRVGDGINLTRGDIHLFW